MKKIYIAALVLICNFTFAQDSRLFENYWYLTNIIENGNNNTPPNSNMGIVFNSPTSFIAQACLSMNATVTFENNTTNFSATNFQYCLCFCNDSAANNYENIYFPFLNEENFNQNTISNFSYTISESQNIRTLTINSGFNKQAIYSNVMLTNKEFKELDFTLSPNPTNDLLEITINNDLVNNATVTVYNEIGLICKTENLNFNTTKIDLNSLPSGVYFVKIKTKNETVSRKIVKI